MDNKETHLSDHEPAYTRFERTINVVNLGITRYEQGLWLQRSVAEAVANGELSETIILLEHPPVFTIGRGGKSENILVSEKILRREGIAVFQIDRGGDVTYHGPGQLVGYPILDLRYHGRDIHRYVRIVEEAIICTLGDSDIRAHRKRGLVGVWVGHEKIASIGINVRRWVTTHGFAFNLKSNLDYFRFINPCGLKAVCMTSVMRQLGYCPEDSIIRSRLVSHFSRLLGLRINDDATSSGLLLKLLQEAGVQANHCAV